MTMKAKTRWTLSCVLIVLTVVGCRRGADSPAATEHSGQTSGVSERLVTLQGCLTRTSDPETFILAVPGDVLRTVRGIGKGTPVPPGADAGPEPASPPTSVPPAQPVEPPPLEPQGRFATPTVRNFTYRLVGDAGADFGSMVGGTVEVTGMLSTEGYPSGDRSDAAAEPRSIGTTTPVPLTTRSVRFVSRGCPGRR